MNDRCASRSFRGRKRNQRLQQPAAAGAEVVSWRVMRLQSQRDQIPAKMVDWNSLLAYSTVKIAKVHDWRLGALHYFFQLFITVYIVGVVCLYNKEYLRTEIPAGTVRVGMKEPAECDGDPGDPTLCVGFQQPATLMQYCEDFAAQRPPDMKMLDNYECRYADANFAVWPPVEQRGVLIATRVTTSSACNGEGK